MTPWQTSRARAAFAGAARGARNGVFRGEIAPAPAGTEGFGVRSVFVPHGETKTVVELGDVWKAEHSYCAIAGQRCPTAVRRILKALGMDRITPVVGSGAMKEDVRGHRSCRSRSSLATAGDAALPGANGKLFFVACEIVDDEVRQDSDSVSCRTVQSSCSRRAPGGDVESMIVLPRAARSSSLVRRTTSAAHLYRAAGVDLFSTSAALNGQTQLTDNCPVSDETPASSPAAGTSSSRASASSVDAAGREPPGAATCRQRDGQRQEGGDLVSGLVSGSQPDRVRRFRVAALMDASGDDIHIGRWQRRRPVLARRERRSRSWPPTPSIHPGSVERAS